MAKETVRQGSLGLATITVKGQLCTVEPRNDRVIVEVIDHQTQIGSIILPDESKKTVKVGVVLAVGPGAYDRSGAFRPTEVVEGNIVMFSTNAAWPVEGKQVTVLEGEIMAVLNPRNSSF